MFQFNLKYYYVIENTSEWQCFTINYLKLANIPELMNEI